MKYDWINSDGYLIETEEIRSNLMTGTLSARTEAQVAATFQNILYHYIKSHTGVNTDFHPETPINECLSHDFGVLRGRTSGRGRLDAVVNNLVIEYKRQRKLKNKKDQETATHQVEDYLYALYKNKHIKYDAILTDGARICYFSFKGDIVEHTAIRVITSKDIDRIIKAILMNDRKKFVPENIAKDFGVSTLAPSLSKDLARLFYGLLKNKATAKTKMLFTEWQSLMHLSYDDNGKGNDIAKRRKDLSLILEDDINIPNKEYMGLFALQTTYAIIVKLIACKVMDKLEYSESTRTYSDLTSITSQELQAFLGGLEDGYIYRSNGIFNLLEGDFFSWYSTTEQWNADLWKTILDIIKRIDEYTAFSLEISYEPLDIFKDLYMSIIPKSVRHSMGEYFTPAWLSDYVVGESLNLIENKEWKAIDPCCGSGTFVITLIKHIVGNVNLQELSSKEKEDIRNNILSRVYGVDINPLSVLSARVGYYFALRPFGDIRDVEIPIYLGDSAIIPIREIVGGIECYRYSVTNSELDFDAVLPVRFVNQPDFGKVMSTLQASVKTENSRILLEVIKNRLSKEELKSAPLIKKIEEFSDRLIELHRNNWDGIWVRMATNFMMIARLNDFDLITGNPPWVKWEHLPSVYANRIKELCNIRHIFQMRGRFGGTQLNICALISNMTASNWLKKNGVLAFLMPDSIMSQNSYEEFRNFYLDYDNHDRLYLQKIDKWEAPLRPFRCDDYSVSQDFNTYYYTRTPIDYSKGIDVTTISRKSTVSDQTINEISTFKEVKDNLIFGKIRAAQISSASTAFSYLSDEYDFSEIIGESEYEYRTGVEFTPQELYMLEGLGASEKADHYKFSNKKFQRSKYLVNDMPKQGWDLPTQYIYPIMTGPSLSPFKNKCDNQFCILPYTADRTEKPVDIQEMMLNNDELLNYLIIHKELIDSQSEKSKQMQRGDEFYSLSKIGPYTFGKYIVAARDNTKFCASVITDRQTPWGETKQTICVKHTMLISRDKSGRFITKDEADYICGILNSSIVVEYMHNTFKSNGFSLKKSAFALPLYDKNNKIHKQICSLAKKASGLKDVEKISEIQKKLTNLYISICGSK